jgi:hypothetical protein
VSKAASPHQGGIGSSGGRTKDGFEVKAVRPLILNLMSFQLVTGNERYFIMGIYIPPNCTTGLADLRVACKACPADCTPLVVGDLNIWFEDPADDRADTIVDLLEEINTTNLSHNFYLDNAASSGDGRTGPSACGGGVSGAIHNRIIFWRISASQRGSGGWHFACHSTMTWTIGRSSQPSGGERALAQVIPN